MRDSTARLWTLLLLALLAQACASVPKRNPLPTDLADQAQIPGLADARVWGDEVPPFADRWFGQSREELQERYPAWFGRQQHYLAISGGGAKGAFGAGLLVGWTEAGNRPEFQLVTGVSTGALTAPFAFLGSEYDHLLEELYTAYSTDDLLNKRNLINAITSDAAASTKKLEALIARYFDEELVEALAREGRKGRNLQIGTTNIDALRPVIWRVSQIAASDHPGKVELIRQIILASASIPAAFPPVAIEVEADGDRYDELHVDGGAVSQVFLYPASIDWARILEMLESPGKPKVYVIRNSRLDPKGSTINRKLIPLASRTISSLIRTQGIGDLYRIYSLSQRDGLEFNLAHIPESFDAVPNEQFDPVWMRELFEVGREMAKAGYPWGHSPPEFEIEKAK